MKEGILQRFFAFKCPLGRIGTDFTFFTVFSYFFNTDLACSQARKKKDDWVNISTFPSQMSFSLLGKTEALLQFLARPQTWTQGGKKKKKQKKKKEKKVTCYCFGIQKCDLLIIPGITTAKKIAWTYNTLGLSKRTFSSKKQNSLHPNYSFHSSLSLLYSIASISQLQFNNFRVITLQIL